VLVPRARVPFEKAYKAVIDKPLFAGEQARTISSEHRAFGDSVPLQTDGIYLLDPESFLFKEWARLDTENSSTHQGFTFTVVAYTNQRSKASVNTTDYYIALDPNIAHQRHLYCLWARIQQSEVQALFEPGHAEMRDELEARERKAEHASEQTRCRKGYEGRAATSQYKALFDDPWFDGQNYQCTIIATPNRGTVIGPPGSRSDLVDDPIAEIVRRELEFSMYTSKVELSDQSAKPAKEGLAASTIDLHQPGRTVQVAGVPEGYFRFGSVELENNLDLYNDTLALQIGAMLWGLLQPEENDRTPPNLREHLFQQGDMLGVWSRRGVVVAYKPTAADKNKVLKDLFIELIAINKKVAEIVGAAKVFDEAKSVREDGVSPSQVRAIVQDSELQMSRIARLYHELSMPEGLLVGHFVQEIELNRVLETLRDVYQGKKLGEYIETVAEVQTKVEWLEIFFIATYATELGKIVVDHLTNPYDPGLKLIMWTTVAITSFAAWYVKPWKRNRSISLWLFASMLALSLIVGLAVSYRSFHDPIHKWISVRTDSSLENGTKAKPAPLLPTAKKPKS
jgi:hypothetical protein